MSVIVGRHEEGIVLNGLEYMLDGKKEKPLIFRDEEEAVRFLHNNGWSDEEIYWLTFKEVTEARCPRCGWPLEMSEVDGYDFTCVGCDEDFYRFEVKGGASCCKDR